MALTDEIRNLEEAIRRCRIARQNYNQQIARAQSEFTRLGQGGTEQMMIRLGITNPLSSGAYVGTVRTLAGPVGSAARLMSRARETMVNQARLVERTIRSLAGVFTDQKTAEHAATTLEVATIEEDYVADKILAHGRTRWALNDPANVPLILVGPRLPGGVAGRTWAESLYRLLAGDAYAQQHPLPQIVRDDPDETSNWMWLVGLGAGVVGGVLVIWLLNKAGV